LLIQNHIAKLKVFSLDTGRLIRGLDGWIIMTQVLKLSNEIFSGTQPRQLVAGRNRRFGNCLCPHHQGSDDDGERDSSRNVGFYLKSIEAAVFLRRFY
jgi:hypothetical protein